MEQLLLVTSCDSPAGIGVSLRTDGRTDGWTDRRDVGNSILDLEKFYLVPTLGWISESPLITAHLSKPLWEADLHVNEEGKKDYQNSSRKELRIEIFSLTMQCSLLPLYVCV